MAINLDSIKTTRTLLPPRIIIYGEHKVGKSTFASTAPNPIFLNIENGLAHIDSQAFPLTKQYSDVLESIDFLYNEKHDFDTLCVDSLDWLEKLIFAKVCNVGDKSNIEDFGYGKGYALALSYWREILDGFDALRDHKGMAVICLAHAQIKRFDAPDVESYDRYKIKLNDKAASLVQEWADVIGFAKEETFTRKTEVAGGKEITRATSSGKRYLHLRGMPSFQAGNRYGMPEKVLLNWPAFLDAFNKASAPPSKTEAVAEAA